MKIDKKGKTEIVRLFVDSAHLIGDPCLNCDVDFDEPTKSYAVNGSKPFSFACVVTLTRNEGIDPSEVYVVPTEELSSMKSKLLSFGLGEGRVIVYFLHFFQNF